MEVAVAEYRNGNDKENGPRKVTGLARVGNVTLKRGIIGTLTLFELVRMTRDGDQTARTVTIQLVSEDHAGPVLTWRLLRARVIKYVSGPFDALRGGIAMEELTLAYERLEAE